MKKIMMLMTTMLLLVTASAQANLVGLWHLDGDATDSSGNENDGTLYGDASFATGMFDQALSLDGDGDYVDCGNVLDVTDQLTLEAWVQDSGFSSGSVVGKYQGQAIRWHIYVYDALGLIYWNIGGLNYATSSAGDIQGDWYHLAMVYDGTQSGNSNRLKAYIDGSEIVLNYVGTIPATMPAISANVNIGRQGSAPYFFNGEIDEVRIWDEALSEDQLGLIPWPGPPANLTVALGDPTCFDWVGVLGATKYSLDIDVSVNIDYTMEEGGVTVTDQILNMVLSFGTSDRTDGGNMLDSYLCIDLDDFFAALESAIYEELGGTPYSWVLNSFTDITAKVKALSPGPKGKGGPQNNPFSEPLSISP